MVIAERLGRTLAIRPLSSDRSALAIAERTAGLLERLEEAQELGDVIQLDRQSGALAGLARAARVGLEEQNQLAATRVKVQHRAGTLLRELASEHHPGRSKRPRGKAPLRPKLPRGVLAAHGISGQESSAWQALASVPFAEVSRRLDELVTAGAEVTSAEFVRRGQASMRTDRNSRVDASPSELRLRAALANLARIRTLTTVAERELAARIARVLVDWGVVTTTTARPDLEHVVAVCLLCGRERRVPGERRCACGGSWTTTLR